MEANRREAEFTSELEMEDARMKREKAANETKIIVGRRVAPKPFRAD